MRQVLVLIKSVAVFVLAALSASTLFGLCLGGAWALVLAEGTRYRLLIVLLAGAVSFYGGGLIVAAVTRQRPTLMGALLGLVAGAGSFVYLLGLSQIAGAFSLVTAMLGAAAGATVGWIRRRGMARRLLRRRAG